MFIKIFCILIIIINFSTIYGQDDFIKCDYYESLTKVYTCELKIYNPNGLNNFTDINGTHVSGKSDDDVEFVRALYLSITPIIPSIICEKFRNTKTLIFDHTGLERIDENSYKNCAHVKTIAIRIHDIQDRIDENSFIGNLELNNLQMDNINIRSLPENIFKNQQKLEFLWFKENNLTDLPPHIFKPLKKLKNLSLNSNLFSAVRPEWFESLENLEYLDLIDCQLEVLPANIFSPLINLKEIALNANKFKIVHSDWFGILPNLQNIYFNLNKIYALDEKLLDITGVYELTMLRNICYDYNIIDRSDTKEVMRKLLKQCFENYKNLGIE